MLAAAPEDDCWAGELSVGEEELLSVEEEETPAVLTVELRETLLVPKEVTLALLADALGRVHSGDPYEGATGVGVGVETT